MVHVLHLLHMYQIQMLHYADEMANPDEPRNLIKLSLLCLSLYATDLHHSQAATHKPLQSLPHQQFDVRSSKAQLQSIL